MIQDENSNLYEILDISPDATPQEIRSAYLRTKAAYTKDSLALYTLVRPEETETYLAQVEEAYRVLSNPEKRKEYDRHYGQIGNFDPTPDNVVSIDRVPPMETSTEDNLLIPPSTDFAGQSQSRASIPSASSSPFVDSTPSSDSIFESPMSQSMGNPFSSPVASTTVAARTPAPSAVEDDSPELTKEIVDEIDWRGGFLRRIRESRRISVEEIADFTKVKRTYVDAIENEEFDRLPAPVFVRGFIIQIAKMLRLPHDKVSTAFMARYQLAKRQKAG